MMEWWPPLTGRRIYGRNGSASSFISVKFQCLFNTTSSIDAAAAAGWGRQSVGGYLVGREGERGHRQSIYVVVVVRHLLKDMREECLVPGK